MPFRTKIKTRLFICLLLLFEKEETKLFIALLVIQNPPAGIFYFPQKYQLHQ